MGGPGVSAMESIRYISEAAEIVRRIKGEPGEMRNGGALTDDEIKCLTALLDYLAEAKLAAVEAREEINSTVAWAEGLRDENSFLQSELVKRGQSKLEAPVSAANMVCDDTRAAQELIRLATLASANQGFRSLDNFASWFAGGTAATLGLIVANWDKVQRLIPTFNIKGALISVIISLGLVAIAKFLGSLITTMAQGAEKVLDIVVDWQERGQAIPSSSAIQVASAATVPAPLRWFPMKWQLSASDPVIQSRLVMRFLMIAGFSTLVAVGIVIKIVVDLAVAL